MTIMQTQVSIEMPREGMKESNALLQSEAGRQASRAWLSELEGAQWQARLRYEGCEQAVSSDTQGSFEYRHRTSSSIQTGVNILEYDIGQHKGAIITQEPRCMASNGYRQLPLSLGGQKNMASIATGVAQNSAVTGRSVINEADSPSMGSLSRSINPLIEWEQSVTHPIITEGKLKLFVRDNQLSDGDVRDLLFQLRDKCTKWGLELALLVVNGKSQFTGKTGTPE